ncbi:MAG: ThiF family adenylyltransferase, partial [Thiobacillaceae bacterium]
ALGAPDVERRFGGLRRLYGPQGAQRLFDAHITVVGIGGVGSWAAEALARSGVSRLTLIDLDHVAESNTNRQIHAQEGTYGQAKVEAMRARIAAIHPACRVCTIDDFVTPDNWADLVREVQALQGVQGPFAVIDACDQMAAKTAMAAWALQTRSVFITAGAAGGKRRGDRV